MSSLAVEAIVGGLCCVSGAALSAAAASLVTQLTSRRGERRSRIRNSNAAAQRRRVDVEISSSEDGEASPPVRPRSSRVSLKAKEVEGTVSIAQWEGFSMEDARQQCISGATKAGELTPQDVLKDLQRGNARFFTGVAQRPELNAFLRRALIIQQYPKVAVLGCSDSRVPVEIVFDQGLGAMFVVRVAGNCLDTATRASLQYAVCHLKVKVLIVMGHEGCGAVKAAGLPTEKINSEPPALAAALTMLKEGLDEQRLSNVHDTRARDREAVVTNVQRQIEGLSEDDHIMAAVRQKELIVVGAFYEISSGIVDFFLEVTETQGPVPKVNAGVEEAPFLPKRMPSARLEDVISSSFKDDGEDGSPRVKSQRVTSGGLTQGVQSKLEVQCESPNNRGLLSR
jgi:carbonic anhydrase